MTVIWEWNVPQVFHLCQVLTEALYIQLFPIDPGRKVLLPCFLDKETEAPRCYMIYPWSQSCKVAKAGFELRKSAFNQLCLTAFELLYILRKVPFLSWYALEWPVKWGESHVFFVSLLILIFSVGFFITFYISL